MMMNIHDWAQRWRIPPDAMSELLVMPLPDMTKTDATEAATQQDIRLKASQTGRVMWRNNNGATGHELVKCPKCNLKFKPFDRVIRYGLGNDSKRINEAFKSSDLIGITPVVVTPQMIGRMLGIFTACEVKRGNWHWSGNPREQGQWNYIQVVNRYGGIGTFAKSVKDYESCLTVHG